jgi:hypothetical protein
LTTAPTRALRATLAEAGHIEVCGGCIGGSAPKTIGRAAVASAVEGCRQGMDFSAALHLAQVGHCDQLATFGQQLGDDLHRLAVGRGQLITRSS